MPKKSGNVWAVNHNYVPRYLRQGDRVSVKLPSPGNFSQAWPLAGSPTLPFGLFGPFQSLTLAQAHTGAAAVFVDEFDAGCFQGAPNGQVVGSRHGRLAVG
jgi:hypothetical protein